MCFVKNEVEYYSEITCLIFVFYIYLDVPTEYRQGYLKTLQNKKWYTH